MVKIEEDIKLDFCDVLIKPKRSTLKTRNDVDLRREFITLHSKRKWYGIPIAIANMDTVGTFEMAIATKKHRIMTCIHKHYTIKEWNEWSQLAKIEYEDDEWQYISISTGISEEDFIKTRQLFELFDRLYILVIDVANGYMENFVEAVKKYRSEYPDKIIIAGNVATSEMTEALILAGADIVKCGIGGGSVCITRKQAGIGIPQLSCILECADAAHGLGGLIMSDGGLTTPACFSKGFGGGADFLMSGGYFAGHDETAGEIIEKEGKKYKQFYGMSSKTAMDKYAGGVSDYRSSEGKLVEIEYRGKVEETILDLLGGIRSTCTYVGARKLKELSKRTTFIRVNRQLNNVYN